MKRIAGNFTGIYILLSLIIFFSQNTGAYFTDTGNSANNDFKAICWTNPNSTNLAFPTDNVHTSAVIIAFEWASTTSSCPIATLTYNFQIFADAGLSMLVAQSGFMSNLTYTYYGVPEGKYWWRVQAKDQFGNSSNSTSFRLTVDRTSPGASLDVIGLGYKTVEDKITNGDFELGNMNGWTAYGDAQVMMSDSDTNPSFTVTPYEGSYMLRLGNAGGYVWQNRLMRSFDSGAKSISLRYNFFSRDFAPNDDPGFFIRLNGQEIFHLASKSVNPLDINDGEARSSGWQQFYYNLDGITDAKANLILYAGNTADTAQNSWVYLDKVTTYFVSASGTASYKIVGVDALSDIASCYYQVDGGGYLPILSGGSFQITSDGAHSLLYYCADSAGNTSSVNLVTVITDTSPPDAITDLTTAGVTANSITLSWTAPGNDGTVGRATSYDIRYSTTNIINDADFESAIKVDKVPVPQIAGSTEHVEIIGLDASTLYYFAIKTLDEAPNTSGMSNILSESTFAGSAVNAGDVVINELMWMGSSQSASDEWIELRNMTDHDIALGGFYLTRYDGTTDVIMLTIPLGKIISAKGYFLISNFAAAASRLKDTVTVDYQVASVSLSNTELSIQLFDGGDNLIDIAWNKSSPQEGLHVADDDLQKYYSMERTAIPGDGANQLNWYSCIDGASTVDYFDGGADERGTPRAQNRSENEPYDRYYAAVAQTSITASVSPASTPEASLILSEDRKAISFIVRNIPGYEKLSYELSYDAFNSSKGLLGSDIDISSIDTFEKKSLDLATCSGEVCMYDQDVKNFKLTVILIKRDGKETKLKKNL
jgi:hypothetical protein